MRRSSSTTSRCGALSGSASAGSAIVPPSALPRAVRPGDEAQHGVAAVRIDHRGEEVARRLMRVRTERGQCARDAFGLQAGKLHGELFALRGDEKEAMPTVVRAFLLQHVAFVDQLL